MAQKTAQKQEAERRTVERGEPLAELVKGSLDYTMHSIRRAFRRQFPYDYDDEYYYYVNEIFADHVIVYSDDLLVDEYYYVTYTREEEDGEFDYIFAPRDQWEVVELAYRPQSSDPGAADVGESQSNDDEGADSSPSSNGDRRNRQRFTEHIEHAARLVESEDGDRIVQARLAQADVVNGNGRRYPRAVMREAVEEAQNHLHESLSQGRAAILGEAEHPSDKRQGPRFLETIIAWDEIWFDEDDGWTKGRGHMIETSIGKDAIVLMDAGVYPGISLRGYGESEYVEEGGQTIEEVQWLRFTGFDMVLNPSFHDAAVEVLESQQEDEQEVMEMAAPTKQEQKEKETAAAGAGAPKTVEELREESPELYEAIVNQAVADYEEEQDEARTQAEIEAQRERDARLRELLGLDEDDDLDEALEEREERRKELEAKEQERAVAAHIAEATKGIKYPGRMKESFVAYIENQNPQTVEEADEVIEEAQNVFDPMAADVRLRSMGMNADDVEVRGPVLEKELGIPAYARASYEISEAMIKHGHWTPRERRPKDSRSARFTRAYLERFDEVHQQHLQRETQQWNEAMLSTQLSLPYSVVRAIMDEAFPQLVAPSIFDIGVVNANPTRVYYEAAFVGETGYEVSVTDESFTSDHDDWVNLDQAFLEPGTIVVTSDPAGTTYTEGTDYVIDYIEGRIKVLSAGSMADATGFLIDYDYQAVRKGENAEIERARTTLAHVTLDLTANRLATEISDEAIQFSQSQLGFDALTRTLNLLMKEIMREIDQKLMYTALAHSLQQANNSGGTWVSGTDPLTELVEKIGKAKVKVANRYYDPQVVLMSLTRSDELSNWDNFTAAGDRPDADLNDAGYVGRVKGLPVFASTEFSDDYVLVHNREVVQYRTFGNMEVRGPFPSYSNGKLVANDQYYAQQYDGYISPLPQKAAHVVIS